LIKLVSQRGFVTKINVKGRTPGAFVLINIGKSAGEEWYIPLQSIQSQESVDKMRNLSMLKSIKIQ